MIATGDVLNRSIRVQGEWGLLPNFGFLSSIYPCELVATNVHPKPFPEYTF